MISLPQKIKDFIITSLNGRLTGSKEDSMKDKIIEVAGKTWRTLGEIGEINIEQIPKIIKEKDPIVYQSLGWLAREDKINYATKNNKIFISLVESELRAFQGTIQKSQSQAQENTDTRKKVLI